MVRMLVMQNALLFHEIAVYAAIACNLVILHMCGIALAKQLIRSITETFMSNRGIDKITNAKQSSQDIPSNIILVVTNDFGLQSVQMMMHDLSNYDCFPIIR